MFRSFFCSKCNWKSRIFGAGCELKSQFCKTKQSKKSIETLLKIIEWQLKLYVLILSFIQSIIHMLKSIVSNFCISQRNWLAEHMDFLRTSWVMVLGAFLSSCPLLYECVRSMSSYTQNCLSFLSVIWISIKM